MEAPNEDIALQLFKPFGTLTQVNRITFESNLVSAKQMKVYRVEIGLGSKKMFREVIFGIDSHQISSSIFTERKLHAHVIEYLGPVLMKLN